MRDPRFYRAYWKPAEQPPGEEELAQVQAQALAIAQDVPDRKVFEKIFQLQRGLELARFTAFESALVTTLQAQPQRLAEWMTALRATIEAEVQTYRESPWFVAYLDAWREEQHPFRVWDSRFSQELRGLHYRGKSAEHYDSDFLFFVVGFLGRLDRNLWFETLDAFPFPNFAYTALWEWSGIVYDRALIEELLRTAPIALAADGEWLPPHRITILLLLDMIVSHADRLWNAVDQHQQQRSFHGDAEERQAPNAVDELTPLRNNELPNWFRSAFRTVLDRPDGQALLIGYFAHLCDGPSMSYRRHDSWDARDCARNILAEELASRGTAVADVRTVWDRSGASNPKPRKESKTSTSSRRRFSEHEGEGARSLSTDGGAFLFAAARIIEESPNPGTEAVNFWAFFAERLHARDRIFSFFDREEVANLFGRLIAYLPAPGDAIRRLYTQLEPQRRRALFWLHYEHDHDAEKPSQFLIRVGLYACASRETWSDSSARRELFWWLYEAARRLWLTSRTRWSSAEDPERLLVARCFAFMPAIFGDNLNEALPRALAPIRNEPWLVSMAGAFLSCNGVEATEVSRLFQNAGIQLPTALRDAHQWVAICESRQGRVDPSESAFPPIARNFAQALHVELEADLAKAQRPSLQNEFRSTIPWGSALWKSLEQEGHTNIRVHLLAAQTWLIQTTAPDALRERFGLSPDIRILAVHGQLVGRDVRLALAKPNDASAIDPDLLVVACDHPDFAQRLAKRIPGPFGQRIPWIPSPKYEFPPLGETFRERVGQLDLFEYRDPVHGNALIGRHEEIDELTQRLLRGEAVGVFGLRKVGKSSMMEAVAERLDPIGARLGMFRFYGTELPENIAPAALVVSFDAQSVGAQSLSNLVLRLIDYLDERLKLAGWPNDKDKRFHGMDPLDLFRYKLEMTLDRSPLPICFMIDEYDLLFAGYNGEGGLPGIERLFGLLRALANTSRRVSLALIGRDPAFVDEPHLGNVTNPLLGWVHHQYLGPLRRQEADELLVRLGKRVGLEVGARSIESGWELTGGHPLLLRQYGSALFELAQAPGSRPRPIPTDPICQEAIDVFPSREAVRTILGEIDMLLAVRFPESLKLLRALASADTEHTTRVVHERGGLHSRALRALLHFGIARKHDGGVWVPKVFRDEFLLNSTREAHEVAGEEE